MAQERLVRAIGRWDLTAAVVNGVIGTAIFSMPSVLAALTGAWSPLVFAAGRARDADHPALPGRGGQPVPGAGGPYLYVREAFGRVVGFQAGWLTFFIRATSAAASLNVFVDYLGPLVPAAGRGRAAWPTMTAVAGRHHRHQPARRAAGDVGGGPPHGGEGPSARPA